MFVVIAIDRLMNAQTRLSKYKNVVAVVIVVVVVVVVAIFSMTRTIS